MADPFLSRPAPPRNAGNRARQRTGSVSANAALPNSSSSRSIGRPGDSQATIVAERTAHNGVSSSDALLSHLQSLLTAKTNEIQLAGQLGEKLLAQQAELENRIGELRHVAADLEASSAAGIRRSASGTLGSTSSAQSEMQSKLGSLEADMAQWERNNEELYRGMASSKPSTASGEQASPAAAASRRERNNAAPRPGDLEFATEIGQSLLGEVRRLQILLTESEGTLTSERESRIQLERQLEATQTSLKTTEESVDKYKEENWNLEFAIQELRTTQADAIDAAQRAESEKARLTKALASARENYDATRSEADRHLASIETLKSKHETSMAEARKTAATLQRERTDLQQALENAKNQLAARDKRRSISVGIESPNNSLRVPPNVEQLDDMLEDEDEEGEDPFLGKSGGMGRPRGSIMPATGSPAPSVHSVDSPMPATNDVGQLRQALAHRQRTIETLRAALQREKEARLRGKRAAEEDEVESVDGSPVQSRKVSRRGGNKRGMGSMRGRMTGRATHVEEDDFEDVDSFEDDARSIREAPESLNAALGSRRGVRTSLLSLDPAFGGEDSFASPAAADRAPSIRRLSRGSIYSTLSRNVAEAAPEFADADVMTDSHETHEAEIQFDSLVQSHQAALLAAAQERDEALQQLRDEHSTGLVSLRGEHAAALEGAARSHAVALDAAQRSHARELARAVDEHRVSLQQRNAEAERTRDSHAAELDRLRSSHAKQSAAIAAQHVAELDALRQSHAAEVKLLKSDLARAIAERDEALRLLKQQHEAAISSLKIEHASAVQRQMVESEQALAQQQTAHAQSLQSARSALAAEHAAALSALSSQHQRSVEDAAIEHGEAVEALRREHVVALANAKSELQAGHDKLLSQSEEGHATRLSDAVARHAAESKQLRDSHSIVFATLQDQHVAALQERDARSQKDLQELHQRLSTEQAAALAAAAANEEQAEAITALKAVHAKALQASSERHTADLEALRAAHAAELDRTHTLHQSAAREQGIAAQRDVHELRQKLTTASEAGLAALAAKHAAALDASKVEHADQLASLRSEHAKSTTALTRAHQDELQASIAALNEQHAAVVISLQAKHDEALSSLRTEHSASSKSVREQHAAALAEADRKHADVLAAARATHQQEQQTAEQRYSQASRALNDQHAEEMSKVERAHATAIASLRDQHAQTLGELEAQGVTEQRKREEKYRGEMQKLQDNHGRILAETRVAHQETLRKAVEDAKATSAAVTPKRRANRVSIYSDTDTEGETDFEDAHETLAPGFSSSAASVLTLSAPNTPRSKSVVATVDAGVQTEEAVSPPSPGLSSRRDSKDTFGGRASALGASAGPILLQTVGERTVSPDSMVRPDSTVSLASSRDTMMPPPVPVIKPNADKSKPPVLSMPPPPTVPPPRTSPRKSAAPSVRASTTRVPPSRPISPPPADLLQRATSPGLLMPTTARQESVGGKTSSPVKRPRAAASVPSLAAQPGRGPRAAASVTEFGTFPRASKPRPSGASSASVASRRSRAQSVASSVTSEGDHSTYGMAPPLPGAAWGAAHGTDPVVIHAITQTMIGDFLHKYTRKTLGKGISEKRHKRFFWVHPYTKTLYWQTTDPAGQYTASQATSKSVAIEGVYEVYDPNVSPPGLCQNSLVIRSPGREIKLTAPSQERHEMWLAAISFLLSRPESESPTSPNSEIGGTFSPASLKRADSALGSTRGMSSKMYNLPSASESRLASTKAPISQSMSRLGSRSRSRMSAASAMQLKRSDTPAAAYLHDHNEYGSPQSVRSFAGSDTFFNDDSFERVQAPDVSYEPEQVEDDDEDEGYDGLENVRVCCGEHDVGRLSRQSRHSHGPHEHHHHHEHEVADGDRPLSPTLSERVGRASASVRSGRKSVASVWSQRTGAAA